MTNSELRPLRPSQRLGLYLCHVKDPGTDGQWAQEDEVCQQTPACPSHPNMSPHQALDLETFKGAVFRNPLYLCSQKPQNNSKTS